RRAGSGGVGGCGWRRGLQPKAAGAEDELLAVVDDGVGDADEGSVGALQIDEVPAVGTAFDFADDLGVPVRHHAVVGNDDLALAPADHNALLPDPGPFAF